LQKTEGRIFGILLFKFKMADNELAKKLARRQNETDSGSGNANKVFNPVSEFPEFSRKEIREYEAMFKKYDTSNDGFLDLQELKYMMEKLGQAQTHVALKQMIKEVDEDLDENISLREFFLIFRKAAKGELSCDGLKTIANSVDVQKEGVGGAKNFFQGKIEQQSNSKKLKKKLKQNKLLKK